MENTRISGTPVRTSREVHRASAIFVSVWNRRNGYRLPTARHDAVRRVYGKRPPSFQLPADDRLQTRAESIEAAIQSESTRAVRRQACIDFLIATADFYQVPKPSVKVLSARPLHVREDGWGSKLFGDYQLETVLIRIWMRTAVRKNITSFGTFLSTLCHEFCHHLDFTRFGFHASPHTRGFYERAAILYHHARGTPPKVLVWIPMPSNRWRINWARTNRTSLTKTRSKTER